MKAIAALTAAGIVAATTTPAYAETYTAFLYGVPGGFNQMRASGAGNGGMMTGYVSSGGQDRAATLTAQGFRNLHPSGFDSSHIVDSWGGTYHAGWGQPTGSLLSHALFWVGGGSAVDLHPNDPAILETTATGVNGQIQCGWAQLATDRRGAFWSRTSSSFHLLRAPEHTQVRADGVDSTQVPNGATWIVGTGIWDFNSETHALLWRTVSADALDLHYAGYSESRAFGCNYPQIVGDVSGNQTGNRRHAALWDINVAFVKDLNPNAAFLESTAVAVRNGVQAGWGRPISTPGRTQAMLWHGNAIWTNLHARLPYPFTLWSSEALDIDDAGNVVGTVTSPDGTDSRPVIWMRS